MSSILDSDLKIGKKNIRRYKVKEGTRLISNEAFADCKELEELELSSTLNFIGERAFLNCIRLDYIKLPNSLVYIGDSAFDCEGHGYMGERSDRRVKPLCITIPPSVEVIDGNPFCQYSIIQSNNHRFKVIDNVLYSADGHILISYCSQKEEFTVPEGVETIGVGAFRYSQIKKISFPNTLKVIEKDAFEDAYNLSDIIFPESLKTIKEGAFWGCSFNCNIVKFPRNIDEIEVDAFDFDGEIKFIQVPHGTRNHYKTILQEMEYTTIYEGDIIIDDNLCFNEDKSEVINAVEGAEFYNIPEGVTRIWENAFCYIEYINTIRIPSTLKNVSSKLFDVDSTDIDRIIVPKGMKEFYQNIFFDYKDVVEEA